MTRPSDNVTFCFLEIQQGVGKYVNHNTVRVLVSLFCDLSSSFSSEIVLLTLTFSSFNRIYYPVPEFFQGLFLRFTLVYFPGALIHTLITSLLDSQAASCPRWTPCLESFPSQFIPVWKTSPSALSFSWWAVSKNPSPSVEYFLPANPTTCKYIFYSFQFQRSRLNFSCHSGLLTKKHEHS